MDRIALQKLKEKVCSADEAAALIRDGMTVACSGFTPAGYPKAVPQALTKRIAAGERVKINLCTGASTGDELDGALTRAGAIKRRFPYQSNSSLRQQINQGGVSYQDIHLSHLPQQLTAGFWGKVDLAVIEAVAINEYGGIIPSTSVGISPQAVAVAEKVIVEINISQPEQLIGLHDIYLCGKPPARLPIPITRTGDRIGLDHIPCAPDKIAAIVINDTPDSSNDFPPADQQQKKVSEFLIDFLANEVTARRLPENLLPLQSGVGAMANAVFSGLAQSSFENLSCYSEVIQDSILELIDHGKVTAASGTSFTPSKKRQTQLLDQIDFYKKHVVLRPMEISNHPEVIRRLGVIAINTAIEIDIYGQVNSTNLLGSQMMNGIGGSGDFTRNGYISIFTTLSTAGRGTVSTIVPMVAHVDHTEHDVDVIISEQGLADLRGKAPRERAKAIISNCAHPDYRPLLFDYLKRAVHKNAGHEPHLLAEALSWHRRFQDSGAMKTI